MKYTAKREEPLGSEQLAEYEEFGFSEKFSRLLYIRGIDTAEKVRNYLDFSLEKLHDPFLLSGMRDAVSRIHTAIIKKERILIIGDYDCDGICATAILYKYLLTRYARTKYFLPNRDADGYGLTIELVEKLHKRFSPQLVITVDCGISCPDEIARAKELGIDCIVTDHHSIPVRVPECITINPKLQNQEYPFNELCGAGVSLKLVQALEEYKMNSREAGVEEMLKYIDLATLATVADIVPLRDENRIIVHEGLKRINANSNPAISALARSSSVYGPIKSQDISFKLGPKINAAGRMGVAKRGLDLLLEKDEKRIDETIKSLGDLNLSRQKITSKITTEAERQIIEKNLDKNNILIVYKENWEGGVLGIVAARITDRFNKPSIVLSKNGDTWKGSARSVRGINMVELISKFSGLLSTFGGHMMAAGLSIPSENLVSFEAAILDHVNNMVISGVDESLYDFSIQKDEIAIPFIKELELLEPIGCENPAPILVTQVGACNVSPLPNHPRHIRFSSRGQNGYINFTMFDGAVYSELLTVDFPKQVIFELQKNLNSEDSKSSTKTLARAVIPQPNDDRSLALTLELALACDDWDIDDRLLQIRKNLVIDRNTFVEYYRLLQRFIGTRINGIFNLYMRAKMIEPSLDLFQFVFVCVVLRQLGIFSLEGGGVQINKDVRAELELSEIYKKIKGDKNE